MGFELDTSPLPEELIRLGLADSPFLVPGEQVQARFGIDDQGDTRVIIYVQDIEVRSVDPISQKVRYEVVGLRQYTQQWDIGGSYLRPEAMALNGIEEVDDF